MNTVLRLARRIVGSALVASGCVLGVVATGAAEAPVEPQSAPVVLSDQELAGLTGGQSRIICILRNAFEGCVEGAAVGGQIGGPAGAKAGCAAGAVVGAADGYFNRC